MKYAKKVIDTDAKTVTIEFADGRKISVCANDLTPDIRDAAMMHGLSQKLGDSYSSKKSVTDAYDAVDATAQNLIGGNWNGARSTAGGFLAAAIAEHTGGDIDAIRAKLSGMDEKQKRAIRDNPNVTAIIKRMELEAAEKRVEDSPNEGITDIAALFQ